ncbi:MAG: hypothetical protein K0S49_1769 [Microbacterium sp.]|jgi:hypothetical protein|nr:hypothetical protein [Microbacterium sp.]
MPRVQPRPPDTHRHQFARSSEQSRRTAASPPPSGSTPAAGRRVFHVKHPAGHRTQRDSRRFAPPIRLPSRSLALARRQRAARRDRCLMPRSRMAYADAQPTAAPRGRPPPRRHVNTAHHLGERSVSRETSDARSRQPGSHREFQGVSANTGPNRRSNQAAQRMPSCFGMPLESPQPTATVRKQRLVRP